MDSKAQVAYFPGPTNLDEVTVGSEYAGIGSTATFRITLWSDGAHTLNCSSGAMSMQLSASREELMAMRSMLDSALAGLEVLEAA